MKKNNRVLERVKELNRKANEKRETENRLKQQEYEFNLKLNYRKTHSFSEMYKLDREVKKAKYNVQRQLSLYKADKAIKVKEWRRELAKKVDTLEVNDKPFANEVQYEYINEIAQKTRVSEAIAEYYEELYKETENDKFLRTGESVKNCSKYFICDFYKKHNVYDIKNINLCHSKFCWNCQKVLQANRYVKFGSRIKELANDYDLYHLALTVKNVCGDKLKYTVEKLLHNVRQLMRLFNGNRKVKGLNFTQYGFEAAYRSLEITFNKMEYHPHLHLILVLKKDIDVEKKHINKFSFNNKNDIVTKFSDMEILIQKVWYLLINDKRITETEMKSSEGYSCMCKKIYPDDISEVFKYILAQDENTPLITYEQFKDLYVALKNVRSVQGYGKLYGINDDIILDSDESYEILISAMQELETPTREALELKKVQTDILYRQYNQKEAPQYISRNSINRIIKAPSTPIENVVPTD